MMNKVEQMVHVGISDVNFVQAPALIKTSGLGSCVGVVLYDDWSKTAGLAHIMQPDSAHVQAIQKTINPAKYADLAIQILIQGLMNRHIPPTRIKAKIAGGAQMFPHTNALEFMRIGPRNVHAIKLYLKKHQIPLISSDVGGNEGRTIIFNPSTSKLKVRSVRKNEYYI